MARKKKKPKGAGGAGNQAYDVPTPYAFRELAETQIRDAGMLETQVMASANQSSGGGGGNSGVISSASIAPLDSGVIGDKIAAEIRQLIGQFGAHASPFNSPASGGPAGGGGSPGAMGGGTASSPLSIAATAAERFKAGQTQGASADGIAGKLGMGAGAGASALNGVTKVVGDFVDKVGGDIGRSGLEKSAGATVRENANPGRFVESALGTAASMGVPGASGLQGYVHKLNQEAEAKDGTSALNAARARLADIAGGLAQRGARFTDQQLTTARDVLQERFQRDFDVHLQISRLKETQGARRSGLAMGGFGG